MNDVNTLLNLDFKAIITSLILILVVAKYTIEVVLYICGKFGIELKGAREKRENHELLLQTVSKVEKLEENNTNDKLKEVSDKIDKVSVKIDELERRSLASENASREALADRINLRYKRYIELQGIPEDEVDEFQHIHAAYKGVGGNHSGDAKYNYCMQHLPILPPAATLNYDHN